MTNILDWKYVLMLVSALAGVAAPIWLWRADIQAKSLRLEVTSMTPIASQTVQDLSGLQIIVNGKSLVDPYFVVVTLEHQGTRPIPASEFESALELRISHGAEVVRAQVVSTTPPELEAKLAINAGSVSIQPLLLNPSDAITFSILTSGVKPVFTARGRIAGVTSVVLSEGTSSRMSGKRIAILLAASFLGFIVTALNTNWNGPGWDIHLRGRAGMLAYFVALGAGVSPLTEVLDSFGYSSLWQSAAAMFLLLAPALIVASWLNKAVK